MAVEARRDVAVNIKSWSESINSVCGSTFEPKTEPDLRLASTCVQIVLNHDGIQLLACDGRDFRSFKIIQPIPEQMVSKIVVDKKRLRVTSGIFEGDLINLSTFNGKTVGFSGLGVDNFSLPDVSERLNKVGYHKNVDFHRLYTDYDKPECDIMLPLDTIRRVITQFDYKKKVNDYTIVLKTPEHGSLSIEQGSADNRKEVKIGFSGNGMLPVPIRLDQSTFKNLIRTVDYPNLMLGGNQRGLLYFKAPIATFEAFIMGFGNRL
jgi:hypothetical protein